jgi:hypothetical protein
MQGVTLFSKERGHHSDAFELALTYNGIEIRRPGESARHLSWERISEWEIEQRRGGVLLTLRGGGAVTPLVIPRWKVDELDLVLRDVTSHATDAPPVVEPSANAAPGRSIAGPARPAAAAAVAAAPPAFTIREPVVDQEPEHRIDEVVSQGSAALQKESSAPAAEGESATEGASEEEVAVSLVWPEDTPLKEFANLPWPVQADTGERGAPTNIDVVLDPGPPSLPPVFGGQPGTDETEAPSWAEWDNPPTSPEAALAERAAAEAAVAAAERVEAERVEAERAEAQRVEAERVEAERVEAQRVEAKRVEAERVEAQRVEAKRVAAERAAAEAERVAAEAERVEAEREAVEAAQAVRVAAERAAVERVTAEQVAAERVAADRAAAETAQAVRVAAERAAVERVAAEREAAKRVAAKRVAAERANAELAEAAAAAAAARAVAERVTAASSPRPLLIPPVEGTPVVRRSTPAAASEPSPASATSAPIPRTSRVGRRRRSRRLVPVKTVATVILLALLATAVVLVLAQSAGAIHLGFLGTPG